MGERDERDGLSADTPRSASAFGPEFPVAFGAPMALAPGCAMGERELRQILDATSEGVYCSDAAGRIVFMNAPGARLLGYDAAKLSGADAHSTFHHHTADGAPYAACDCPIHQTLTDGRSRRVDSETFFRKDGTSIPVEYSAAPLYGASGEVAGCVVCFHDITDRRRTEEERRALLAR